MAYPFDFRLQRHLQIPNGQLRTINYTNDNGENTANNYNAGADNPATYQDNGDPYTADWYEMPFDSGDFDFNISEQLMLPSDVEQRKVEGGGFNNQQLQDKQQEAYDKQAATGNYTTTPSILNPYAHTRLYGAKGARYLIDDANLRKYYEEGDERGHYASNPTTSSIIKWGALDKWGRTPYSFQDFVFCKYWNIIPNNRLITLRRYAAPVGDNLSFDFMLEANGKKAPENGTKGTEGEGGVDKNIKSTSTHKTTMHPVATALTYFGEGTDNKISDLLKFSAHMNWTTAESDIWDVTGEAPSMERLEKATNVFGGWGKIFGAGISTMSTAMALLGDGSQFDFRANQGLPPDPYKNGPYNNQMLGPLNCIKKTYKRDRGLEFQNEISLNFHYVARPIGGINNKAALLDALSNMLVMGYSSGVWWGGSHRFRVEPTTYPYTCSAARNAFWQGKLLGKNGAVRLQMKYFHDSITTNGILGGEDNLSLQNLFGTALASIGTLAEQFLETFGMNNAAETLQSLMQGSSSITPGNIDDSVKIVDRLQKMVGSAMQKQIGHIQYMDGMKAILTGDPIGDWHLTIGNPMNPIAEIGNLICKDISIKFDDELGPDDFPIGFTATIKLDHGTGRDRDGIEAMFNKGAGRIYVLPDKYVSSADGQTKIDKTTGKKMSGVYSAGPQNFHSAAASTKSTAGRGDNLSTREQRDAYVGMTNSAFDKLTSNRVPDTMDINGIMLNNENMSGWTHYLMPWQTHVVM